MPRTVWKGAISFGLVHIPVALRAASRTHDLDFDWLDRRDMAPVGYQRINKRTGKAIESEHVVKGYQYEKEQYVLLGDEDFRAANPEATQSVDILAFVEREEIAPGYFEQPYYLEALRRGEKGYALLREVLRKSGRAGVAKVVIHAKQHLALLLVQDEWLMLITMRFADELLAADDLVAVPKTATRSLDKRELQLAQRLVDDMTQPWQPAQYEDSYRDDLLRRIHQRVKAGQTHELATVDDDAPARSRSGGGGAKVIDLMAALRDSLARKNGAAAAAPPAARKRAADSTAAAPGKSQRAASSASRSAGKTAVAAVKQPARSAKASPKTAARKRA